MPTIKLTDNVGIEVNAELPEDSSITKYLQGLTKLKFDQLKFDTIRNITLDQIPLKSLETGISVSQPIAVGGKSELKINAGISGSVKFLSAKDEALFDPKRYDDPIPIAADQFYLGIGFKVKVAPEFTSSVGDLSFGLSSSNELAYTNYRSFKKGAAGFPPALSALQETVTAFSIPRDVDDLAAMKVGTVATVEGSGSLKVSGEVDLLSVTNPLAALNLPEPVGGALELSSGGSIKVGASVELSGSFQIRVHKLAEGKITLGIHRERGTEFAVKASASVGLALNVGDFEVLETVLKAVSSKPEADLKKLKEELSEDQVAAIKKVVEAGIARKLEVAVAFELTSFGSSAAAFLFEIDLSKLDDNGRKALHDALGGNLTKLPAQQAALPAGISLVRSIFTEVKKKKHALKFNLLGIYNFISVSTLIIQGRVMFEPATGELVITDSVTASRIAASSLAFATDGEKLRKVLAESVLISAVYRASKLVIHQPVLQIAHSAFELHTKTSKSVMKDNLDVFEALGLMAAPEKNNILGLSTQFGRTTLYAETAYDDKVVDALFLSNGKPRPQTDYDTAGRRALALLVQKGDQVEARRLPATDDALWKEMTQVAQPGFSGLDKLRNLSGDALGAIRTDYTTIRWWSQAMKEMSAALAEVRDFITANPGANPEADPFKSLRLKLASKIKEVASNTRSEFGDPWGLVAMDQASGQKAAAQVRLNSPTLSIHRARNS